MKILVVGANGRMGQEMKMFLSSIGEIFFGIDKQTRQSVSIVPDVILDFSCADALEQNLELAKSFNVPIVIATTNHSKDNMRLIKKHALILPVFMSANFSILFNLMKKLCESVKGDFEYLLTETHHKNKKDKPSGSAKVIIKKLNQNSIRPKVVCNRIGDVIGIHCLQIYSKCEKLELSHTAYSRQVFCMGAYKACEYILTKQKGLFGMEDLLSDCL